MSIDIVELVKPIAAKDVVGLEIIFKEAFGLAPSADFFERLNEKPDLSLLIARKGGAMIGFKIGYRRFRGVFFSWLGAVATGHRRKGIARALLERQHSLCLERGYQEVQTEASGDNQAMLILNLQEGFEVYGMHMGREDKLTVQLRKALAAVPI